MRSTTPSPSARRSLVSSCRPDHEGGYTAELKLHVQGAPMTGSGTRRLSPDGHGGTRDEIRIDIRAAIPLIGRKVEELAAPMVAAAAEIETELLAQRAG